MIIRLFFLFFLQRFNNIKFPISLKSVGINLKEKYIYYLFYCSLRYNNQTAKYIVIISKAKLNYNNKTFTLTFL